MKKLFLTLISVLLISSTIAFAQVPKPHDRPSGPQKIKTPPPIDPNDPPAATGPVGTATALLLGLGAGTVAYKVRKNKKEKEEAKN